MKNKRELFTLLLIVLLFTISLNAYEEKSTYPSLQRDDNKETVYDPLSKLLWQDNSDVESIKKDWKDAKAYCQDLNFAGYEDWRLPSIKELESIVDYHKYAIAWKKGFKHLKHYDSYYWSSSPALLDISLAWYVDFSYGYSHNYYKVGELYVCCTRTTQ